MNKILIVCISLFVLFGISYGSIMINPWGEITKLLQLNDQFSQEFAQSFCLTPQPSLSEIQRSYNEGLVRLEKEYKRLNAVVSIFMVTNPLLPKSVESWAKEKVNNWYQWQKREHDKWYEKEREKASRNRCAPIIIK